MQWLVDCIRLSSPQCIDLPRLVEAVTRPFAGPLESSQNPVRFQIEEIASFLGLKVTGRRGMQLFETLNVKHDPVSLPQLVSVEQLGWALVNIIVCESLQVRAVVWDDRIVGMGSAVNMSPRDILQVHLGLAEFEPLPRRKVDTYRACFFEVRTDHRFQSVTFTIGHRDVTATSVERSEGNWADRWITFKQGCHERTWSDRVSSMSFVRSETERKITRQIIVCHRRLRDLVMRVLNQPWVM